MNFFAPTVKSYVLKQFHCVSMQIPLCVHANSAMCPCKFRCASMQMSYKDPKKTFSAWKLLTISD